MRKTLFKRSLIALATLLVILLATGCGDNKASTIQSGTDKQGSSNATSQDKTVLKFAHGQGVDSVPNKAILAFADEVKQKSNGKIEVQIFPANQLGNERDLAEGLRMGTIDMAYISLGVMENFEQQFALFGLPFIFENVEQADKIMNGPIGQKMYDKLLKEKGIRVFGAWRKNPRYVYSNKPITKAGDFQSLKIRVPESPTFVSTFKALGANPTPIPWGEVYTSMQTHVVEAFEVPTWSVAMDKLYEVCKYVAKTGHIIEGSLVMINEKKWQSLPADAQKIISEAAKNAQQKNYDDMAKTEETDLKLFQDKGLTVNEFSDTERQKMVEAVQAVINDVGQKINAKDVLEEIKSAQ